MRHQLSISGGQRGAARHLKLARRADGASLPMPAIAYYLLQKAIVRRHGAQSVLATALGRDIKGKLSPIL
jgi:hypothetical protein